MKKSVLICLMMLFASRAHARAYIATPKAQPVADTEASPMLGWSGYYGFQAGGRVGWLLSNPGFVPVINNSVYIEGSAFLAESGHLFLAPLLMWQFHLHPVWSVYGEAGAELGLPLGKEKDDDGRLRHRGRDSGLVLMGGGIYRFRPNMALRLEAEGLTQAFRIGVMLPM